MNCEECPIEQACQATLLCRECDQLFCLKCDIIIHSRGKRRTHSRLTVCNNCRSTASLDCVTCGVKLCETCKSDHKLHRIIQLNELKTLAVFWDISNITSISISINTLLQEITNRIVSPKFVKFYSAGWAHERIQAKGEVVSRYKVSPLDSLLLDLDCIQQSPVTDVLIISTKINEIRKKLSFAKTGNVKILFSDWTCPMFLNVWKEEGRGIEGRGRERDRNLAGFGDLIEFFDLEAEGGRIWIEKNEVLDHFFGIEDFSIYLDEAVKKKVVWETVVKFHEKILFLYSIYFEEVNEKVIKYIVKSLKFDEISLTARAIKTRLKKVFGLSCDKDNWKKVKNRFFSHSRTKSITCEKQLNLNLAKASYTGLDHYKTDVFSVKHSESYEEFILFSESYFSNHFRQGIQMSRFGLSLLIKHFGPESLKFLSIGKLIYMTNLALSDDLFRIHSSKLFWSKDFRIMNSSTYTKFKDLKKYIIEAVSSDEKIKLSNLRQKLKDLKNFDINLHEFGYHKIRELMRSIPEIEVSGQYLKVKTRGVLNPDRIVEAIEEIVKSKEYAITEAVLQVTLQAQLNQSIDWTDYNVGSCEEFIRLYSRSDIQVLKTRECIMLFKSNKQKTYSFFFPFKSYFNSAVLECSKVPTPQIYQAVSHSFDLHLQSSTKCVLPMQRIINISNVPSDIVQFSPARDDDLEDNGNSSFYIEGFSVNNEEKVASRSKQHSKNSSGCGWHIRAQSFHVFKDDIDTRLNFSWIDGLLV